jgi:hypothetical protein
VAATLFMDGSEPDSTAKGELAQDRADLVGCAREGGFDGLASLVKVAPAFVVDGEDGSWRSRRQRSTASRAVMV